MGLLLFLLFYFGIGFVIAVARFVEVKTCDVWYWKSDRKVVTYSFFLWPIIILYNLDLVIYPIIEFIGSWFVDNETA